jgi:hypothetical protein
VEGRTGQEQAREPQDAQGDQRNRGLSGRGRG